MTETAADTTRTGGVVPTALEAAVTTTDHLRIGRAWLASGALLLVASLVAGLLVSVERMDLTGMAVFGDVDSLFRFWSAYRVGLVLLVVVLLVVLVTAKRGLLVLRSERATRSKLGIGVAISSILVVFEGTTTTVHTI